MADALELITAQYLEHDIRVLAPPPPDRRDLAAIAADLERLAGELRAHV